MLLDGLKKEPLFRGQLAGGTPLGFVNGVLKASLPDGSYDLVATPANLTRFRDFLRAAGVPGASVELTRQPAEPAPPPPVAARPAAPPAPKPEPKPAKSGPVRLNPEDFRNDPQIKAALEVFRAQLIEVRAPGDSGA